MTHRQVSIRVVSRISDNRERVELRARGFLNFLVAVLAVTEGDADIKKDKEKERREKRRGRLEATARWQSALSTCHPTSLDTLSKVRILIILRKPPGLSGSDAEYYNLATCFTMNNLDIINK